MFYSLHAFSGEPAMIIVKLTLVKGACHENLSDSNGAGAG